MTRRPMLRFVSRRDAVAQLRARLERGSFPRLQMMLLVALTGAAGFLASVVLLWSGLSAMGPRYLLACAAAYLCFLALLGVWIRWRRGDHGDFSNLPDFGSDTGHGGWHGGGGQSGGGGASASFDAPSPSAAPTPSLSAPEDAGSGLGDIVDVDAAAIPVVLALLVLALLLSSLFVVWSAPALFAELLLDGVLASGLYRRLKHIETRHWLQTAVRKTAWPFLLTALALGAGGFALQSFAPHADSIGDVLPLARAALD